MEPSEGISDYVDIERLQSVQDICSKALGIALVTVDYRGVPITRMSGFTRHCSLGRKEASFCAMCERCDAFGGIRSTTTNGPCVYRCHAGLVDFAVPLVVQGNYLGAVLAGQVKVSGEPEGAITDVIPSCASVYNSPELLRARDEIVTVDYERLISAAETVQLLIASLLGHELAEEEGSLDAVIKDKDVELAALRSSLGETQRTLHRRTEERRRLDEVFRCFFPVMNELHELAAQESASSTDNLLLDFVDVSRYILEAETEVVTLGEEVDHVEMLLRILAWRYEGLLTYSVHVPERLYLAPCPFMVLRPIVLAALQDPWGSTPHGGCEVRVGVTESEAGLRVWVLQSTLSEREVQRAITASHDETSFTIADANMRLEEMCGDGKGLKVSARGDGGRGCVVSFELPAVLNE